MQKGKKLEKQIQQYFKSNADFYIRLQDASSSGGVGQAQAADYILFTKYATTLIEAKETQKIKLPISNFRPKQLQSMEQIKGHYNTHYYVVVKLQNVYCLVSSVSILEEIKNGSLSIDLTNYAKFDTCSDCMDFLYNEIE